VRRAPSKDGELVCDSPDEGIRSGAGHETTAVAPHHHKTYDPRCRSRNEGPQAFGMDASVRESQHPTVCMISLVSSHNQRTMWDLRRSITHS
jgi:hypothetical protein